MIQAYIICRTAGPNAIGRLGCVKATHWEMQEAYVIVNQTYHHIDYIHHNVSELAKRQESTLLTIQWDFVAQMRTTHPIQQKMLEAKIA